VDGLVTWAEATRECARSIGKENFFISGEVTANHALGAVYMGRGRTPRHYQTHIDAMSLARNKDKQQFIRDKYGIEGSAFHYTIHRKLNRFLGLDPMQGPKSNSEDGVETRVSKPTMKPLDMNEADPSDLDMDFADMWKHMMISVDFVNPNTGNFDPRNMYGVSNPDVFRWAGLELGLERQAG
jgi:alpha-1,3-glucan synthase